MGLRLNASDVDYHHDTIYEHELMQRKSCSCYHYETLGRHTNYVQYRSKRWDVWQFGGDYFIYLFIMERDLVGLMSYGVLFVWDWSEWWLGGWDWIPSLIPHPMPTPSQSPCCCVPLINSNALWSASFWSSYFYRSHVFFFPRTDPLLHSTNIGHVCDII